MKLLPSLMGLAMLGAWLLTGARAQQPRSETFRYQRAVIPGGSGSNRLLLDVAIIAAASPFQPAARNSTAEGQERMVTARGGLSDLRMYDSANREVPYLLVSPQAPEARWSQGHILPVAAARKNSGFEMDLGKPAQVDRLRVGGIPAPFLKRARLEGSGDRSHWTVLVEEGTLFDLPAESLSRLALEFEPGEYRYFRVTWDDSASARVPIPGSASARLVSAVSLPPPLRAPLQFDHRASEPGVSRYRINLPGTNLPVVALDLTAAGENILRKVRVTESRLSNVEMAPQVIGLATLWHSARGGTGASELRIPIDTPHESQLELTITDGDNPPLEFTSISAVFAYLPWIYFESPGTEPLTARFGRPDLAAPQYDLEAMRASIPKVRTLEAHWGEIRTDRLSPDQIQTAASMPLAGAQLDAASFRFSRKIPDSKPGLNALSLDAEVLAHSNMADLRIAGQDGRQIPYLTEKLEEPLTVVLPVPERTGAPAHGGQTTPGSQSWYLLRLPYENLPGARLVLTTTARVFRRGVRILVERNPYNERQEPWTEQVAAAAWNHADTESTAPALMIPLPPLKTTETRLLVEEGDNSPLPIESARLLLPSYRLRFFRTNRADLTLYYGRNDLEAPRYDLALLGPRLMGAAAEEISFTAGSASETVPTKGVLPQTRFFWLILAAAVVMLLALIARLVKKSA